MPTMWRPLIPAICAVAMSVPAASPAMAAPITVRKGVAFGKGVVTNPSRRSTTLRLDLYRPSAKSKKARPVAVLIHGGGFRKQSRTDPGIVRTARALAARGIVAASIDYRLLPQAPVPSRRVAPLVTAFGKAPLFSAMAAAVDDTLTATDYLRAHAKTLGIDTRRLGLIGSSAGAITADHVAYVLDDHGIEGPKIRFVGSLWGGIFVPAPARLGSPPANQLERGEPPLFSVHGDKDPTVPVVLEDQLQARARAQHVRATYYRIPGGVHGYDGSQFFTRRVKGSQTAFDRLLVFARDRLR